MGALLLGLAAVYAGLCALLWLLQDQMVFPGARRGGPETAVPPPAEVAWIGPADRRTRIAVVRAPLPAAVALYFGGNGEDLAIAAAEATALARHGLEVIAVEYPGYGQSPGRPSVAGLLATAEAAASHGRGLAIERSVPLVAVGSSLGSFCAVHLAAAGRVDRIVLRAPPTSLAAVGRARFWWLPVDLLLRHRFDNLAVAGQVAGPALVVHGDADDIVPPRFGRELAEALRARFLLVPGAGHNSLGLSPAGPAGIELGAFLTGR